MRHLEIKILPWVTFFKGIDTDENSILWSDTPQESMASRKKLRNSGPCYNHTTGLKEKDNLVPAPCILCHVYERHIWLGFWLKHQWLSSVVIEKAAGGFSFLYSPGGIVLVPDSILLPFLFLSFCISPLLQLWGSRTRVKALVAP